MSTLVGQASNVRLAILDGKAVGIGEIIILVADPVYSNAFDGIKKDHVVKDLRVEASAVSLRKLAQWIGEVADDVEEAESRVSVAGADE